MYKYGKVSKERLTTCKIDLQRVCEKALSYGVMDIAILEGHRSLEKQQEYFHQGKSTLDGVQNKSKHQAFPSSAVDIMPYPGVVNDVNVWDDFARWHILAGVMYAAAAELGVKIRWGGDWNNDGNGADQTFHDYPHFELVE